VCICFTITVVKSAAAVVIELFLLSFIFNNSQSNIGSQKIKVISLLAYSDFPSAGSVKKNMEIIP
jgi:hypothetical protein